MDSTITGFHAHLYYDADSLGTARAVRDAAGEALPVEVGRLHEKPVGPHPMWSCQLAFGRDDFAEVVTWLALHRRGLTVFVHPETGQALQDHRDHALWMGSMPALKLEMFN
ncbi:4,5-dioxygenase [Pseudooceanicola lipolyticus]|uniref:4,5-dioxygenase n=1 Tax=Pseudooceanicola lipolyticus TaxID=2029104 RepID=A0A2M8IZC6_9RHOB|nr:DOPA 4,5-dioxygenase family protein [Pseudooceanicola lipolyticus]PJE35893.1 4,5-dioxygenase [Pseudooceanicola lipolyticus]